MVTVRNANSMFCSCPTARLARFESFMLTCRLGRVVLTSRETEVDAVNIESNGAWLFLPKQRLAEMLTDAVREVGLGLPQRVVLLAEDEPVVRNLVQSVLVGAGYAVITAVDGREALDLSRAYGEHIDVLVSDITMSRMTGAELAAYIRRERPATRILLMSGKGSGVLKEYAIRSDFLPKPFVPQVLIKKIDEVVNRGEGPESPEMW